MQHFFPPDSPELEVDEADAGPVEDGAKAPARLKLTEAQEHYFKHHADWLPPTRTGDLSIAPAPAAASPVAPTTTAAARKSRFGLRVPASPAFVAGGSLHSTSTQNKAVLLPPTLSSSSPPPAKSGEAASPRGGSNSSPASSSGTATSPVCATAGGVSSIATAATSRYLSGTAAASASGSPAATARQKPAFPSAAPSSPLNIDSRAVLGAAAAGVGGKTRVLSSAGGLPEGGVVKTLENSATSAAAGALVAAAFGRGAAVSGSTPQSAKFAAAAAAAEAAARAAAAGRTEKGLPPDALVDGVPVQSFSHLRVMKEGTCVEVFCLPLLFLQARSTGHLILGRGEAADIPTEHPSCSRLHCELRRMPAAASAGGDNRAAAGAAADGSAAVASGGGRFVYTLKDLGSGHGTLINGGRVAAGKDNILEDEDEIQLGFSQRLYMFFTGRETFGQESPLPKEQPQAKKTSPSPRSRSSTPFQNARSHSSAAASAAESPQPPAAAPPLPPSSPPPPAPPPLRPGDEEGVGAQQRQFVSGVSAGGSTLRREQRGDIRDLSSSSSSSGRWRAHQQQMEHTHWQRVAAAGGTFCPYPETTDAEQVMQQQHRHGAFQQQQEEAAFVEGCGNSSDCSGLQRMNAGLVAGREAGGGWGYDLAQQRQLLYWQQFQQYSQGIATESEWGETAAQQWWSDAGGYPQGGAAQYAQEQQRWDATAAAEHPYWESQQEQLQQPSSEGEYSFPRQQQQQRRCSGWSSPSSSSSSSPWALEGDQQEELQHSDERQQQQQDQQRQHQQRECRAEHTAESSSGRGRGRGLRGGESGSVNFKRRVSSAAARKLLWQHAGKKQQGDDSSAATGKAVAAAGEAGSNKRIRLDGAKIALWGRAADSESATAGGKGEQPDAAAEASARVEGGSPAAGSAKATSSCKSSGWISASAGGRLPLSPGLIAAAAAPVVASSQTVVSGSSSASDNVEKSKSRVEGQPQKQRVFCAHILLSFVRRADTEPWWGSRNSNRNSSGSGALTGRGGRVVTRCRDDALSSLKSVKDITKEDQTQFGEFAAELSDCPSSKKRGVLGWIHAGQPGGKTSLPQQQQQTERSSSSSSSKKGGQQHPPQRRTAVELAAQARSDVSSECCSSSSSTSGKNEENQDEDWWLPQEVVEAAVNLQIGELSEVIESENGAHLLLRLQ